LRCLKNGAGKPVGKTLVFLTSVHTFGRMKSASNTISIRAGGFPAVPKAKPFDKYHEDSCFKEGFPQFPQGVGNFLWKTKSLSEKGLRAFVTICPCDCPQIG